MSVCEQPLPESLLTMNIGLPGISGNGTWAWHNWEFSLVAYPLAESWSRIVPLETNDSRLKPSQPRRGVGYCEGSSERLRVTTEPQRLSRTIVMNSQSTLADTACLRKVIPSKSPLHTLSPRPRASVSCGIDERQRSAQETQWLTRIRLPPDSEWKNLYRAAILETHWSKMHERIEPADLAIKGRLFEFSQDHGGTPEENQAIRDALSGLSVLRRELKARQESKRSGSKRIPLANHRRSMKTHGRNGKLN